MGARGRAPEQREATWIFSFMDNVGQDNKTSQARSFSQGKLFSILCSENRR